MNHMDRDPNRVSLPKMAKQFIPTQSITGTAELPKLFQMSIAADEFHNMTERFISAQSIAKEAIDLVKSTQSIPKETFDSFRKIREEQFDCLKEQIAQSLRSSSWEQYFKGTAEFYNTIKEIQANERKSLWEKWQEFHHISDVQRAKMLGYETIGQMPKLNQQYAPPLFRQPETVRDEVENGDVRTIGIRRHIQIIKQYQDDGLPERSARNPLPIPQTEISEEHIEEEYIEIAPEPTALPEPAIIPPHQPHPPRESEISEEQKVAIIQAHMREIGKKGNHAYGETKRQIVQDFMLEHAQNHISKNQFAAKYHRRYHRSYGTVRNILKGI